MEVWIRSPARLHLGIIDLSEALGRKYGSIGVAIDDPFVEIRAKNSSKTVVRCLEGVEISPAEVKKHVDRILTHYGIDGGVEIEVRRDIPRHVGLGSTTQMALSVGTAITKLYGISASVRDLSKLFGLGKISGIGTAVFESGGFLVDCGLKIGQQAPPTLIRLDFPEKWFFVIAVPENRKGLYGEKERKVFQEIHASPEYAMKISHLLLMKMLPAVIEEDIKSFGEALTAIQMLVGETFSRYQEGLYHSKVCEELVRFLLENGAYGSGQSSWGPTVYGIVDGKVRGKRLEKKVREFMAKKKLKGYTYCVAANNEGASIRYKS